MSHRNEKLPIVNSAVNTQRSRLRYLPILRAGILSLALLAFAFRQIPDLPQKHHRSSKVTCHQAPPYQPKKNEQLDGNREEIFSAEYREASASILSRFVQVKSPSFDDLGKVGEDSRWDVFYDVSRYLNETFPDVYNRFSLEKVNTHGIVLTLQGSDSSLKPTLLAGHLDVVPVDPATLTKWTYPPWEGHYDGQYLWGRGSVDDKHAVTAILESLAILLRSGFEPARTIILAFGFDEESKGKNGAGHIAKHLENKYGKDSIEVIVDEGGLGIGELFGTTMAVPAVGEKGYVDVKFTLTSTGGHSSLPPDHTGIGIVSQIVATLESNPFQPSLALDSPVFSLLSCASKHGHLPTALKKNIEHASRSGRKGEKALHSAAKEMAALGRNSRYLVQTSQAVDIIRGGVKVNALPESVDLTVNYRVAIDSTIQVVKNHITDLVLPIAQDYSLDVEIFGRTHSFAESSAFGDNNGGHLRIVSINELPPAPVLPTDSAAWSVFSGTIKETLGKAYSNDTLIVSPGVMTGNTDTRYYWNLTRNIYRFTPMDRTKSLNLHTVDERLFFDDHINAVWFFHELVRGFDEADLS